MQPPSLLLFFEVDLRRENKHCFIISENKPYSEACETTECIPREVHILSGPAGVAPPSWSIRTSFPWSSPISYILLLPHASIFLPPFLSPPVTELCGNTRNVVDTCDLPPDRQNSLADNQQGLQRKCGSWKGRQEVQRKKAQERHPENLLKLGTEGKSHGLGGSVLCHTHLPQPMR